jgi:xylan 1,4-beta-xylosidase
MWLRALLCFAFLTLYLDLLAQPGEDTYPEGSYQVVKTYLNPVLPGDHPDLTLLKVGSDFYTCNSSFHFTPYLAISHSTDLVHWEVISRVISPEWSGLISGEPKQGIWQGAITYFYGSYWIYFSNTAGGGQYFSKAEKPSGPWSAPVKMKTTPDTGASGYDNAVFVDDDGTPYMSIKPGRNTNRIQKIGADGHLTEAVINLDWVNAANQYSWAEGPVLCKRDGWYYYFIAGNVGGGQYVLRSQSLTSDPASWQALGDFFAPVTDPLTPFRGPNHIAQPFQLENGTWWTLSHSYANLTGDGWGGKGRQGLMHQVTWDSNGKPIGAAPTTMPQIKPDLPKSGIPWKLPRSDYFDSSSLQVWWHFLGPGAASRYSLTEQPGWLRIKGGSKRGHLLQKDAGRYYAVITRVHFDATDEDHGAGLYLTNGNESVNVRLYSGYADRKEIIFAFGNTIHSAQNSVGNTVWLKLERKEHDLYGYYSADGSTWIQVGERISAVDLDKNQVNDNWWVGNSHGLFAEGQVADFDLYFYRDGASDLLLAGSENYFGVVKSNTSVGTVFSNTTDKGGWLMLGAVELGKDATRVSRKVEVTIAAQAEGNLELWLDDLENEGTLIATIPVTSTGGTDTWKKFSTDISNVPGGQHDVYVRFSAPPSAFLLSTIRFVPDINVAPYPEAPIVGMEEKKNSWLKVYPNPYEHTLNVDLGDRKAGYVMYDLLGRKVEEGRIISPGQTIGNDLKPALYQLVIITKDSHETIKILKLEN